MRTTTTILGEKARKAVLRGVTAVYEPTHRTFGPQGKNALLYRTFNRGSRITNDGFTVAEVQEPKDPFARLAATTFKEACKKTNEKVGDGTTGTAILGGVLYQTVYNLLGEGASYTSKNVGETGVMSIRRKILESAERVKKAIQERATKIDSLQDLEKIAIVSVEDVELGKTIARVAYDIGVDGFIDVVEGFKGEVEVEVIKGQRFPAKIGAKAFVNNPARYEMVVQDCPVLLTNHSLDNAGDYANTLAEIRKASSKIVIIAPSFSQNTLIDFVQATKNGYFIFPVAVPSLRTEVFEDLAIYFDAKFIDKNKGQNLRSVTPQSLGFVEKLVVKDTEAKEDAVATGGRGSFEKDMSVEVKTKKKVKRGQEEIEKEEKTHEVKFTSPIAHRIEVLKGQLAETQDPKFKALMERRIANMASAVGIIRVGDTTQASSLYRKLKIEDAVYACKAALRGGYVRGAGVFLKEIADTLEDDDILKKALMAPYEQIQASLGGDTEHPIAIGEDIIDPAEAIYYAVDHATSVVASLATVDSITVEQDDPIHGEGEFAIADALRELVINDRIHKGQITENEREMERDRMGGLTDDEFIKLDRG